MNAPSGLPSESLTWQLTSGRDQPLVAARIAADEAVTPSVSVGGPTDDDPGIVDAAGGGDDVDLEPDQEGSKLALALGDRPLLPDEAVAPDGGLTSVAGDPAEPVHSLRNGERRSRRRRVGEGVGVGVVDEPRGVRAVA